MLNIRYDPPMIADDGCTHQMAYVAIAPGPDITYTTKETAMRCKFDDNGNLVIIPETTLERMAAKAFVQSMRHRNKPQILIDEGMPPGATPCPAILDVPGQQRKASVSLIAQESDVEVPGQQRLDEVAREVGGI